jgi:hypothetical protein
MTKRRNAIARRLDRLNDQWNEFASNEDARLLRWLARDDELRVIEAFIQTEQDDRAGEIPDLFLTFAEPFRDVASYGESLRESLLAQYGEARPELREARIPDTWSPPSPEGRHSLTAFIEACASLHRLYGDMVEKLAVVLTPTTVSNKGEWQRWLSALVDRLPGDIRVAVIDSVEGPALVALAEKHPARVVTTVADLDMPAAITELSRMGGVSKPDGQFRVRFTALTQALEKGDLAAAQTRAEAAITIAQSNRWMHMVAAVHMAMGAGFLSAGQWAEATKAYGEADTAAAQFESEEPEVGQKLRLQIALGRAAVLFASQEFVEAADAYEGAAAVASSAGDDLMRLESWRMASYCREQAGDMPRAWANGLSALEAAEAMPSENRTHSTLPFVGEGLLRVAEGGSQDPQFVDRRLTELLGTPQWRALVAAALETA